MSTCATTWSMVAAALGVDDKRSYRRHHVAMRPSVGADGSTKDSMRPCPQASGSVASAVAARISGRSPHGWTPSGVCFTVGSPTMSPSTRFGYVPANSASIVPASAHPNRTAESIPKASITARMSSIRSSSVATLGIRSDIPVPRLSNVTTRLNVPSRSRKRKFRKIPHRFDVRDPPGEPRQDRRCRNRTIGTRYLRRPHGRNESRGRGHTRACHASRLLCVSRTRRLDR